MSEERDGRKYADKLEEIITSHVAYFDHIPWPKIGGDEWTDFVRSWVEAFGERGYSPRRVEKAMRTIRRRPPQWKHEHLPELMKLIDEDENLAQPSGREDRREDDPNAPPCEFCEGGGFAAAYRSDYQGEPGWYYDGSADRRRVVCTRVVGPCVCPKGRRIWSAWLAQKLKCDDLANLPRGWSLHDPTQSPAEFAAAVRAKETAPAY